MKQPVKTDVELMHAILEDAFWNIGYHEHELMQASKQHAAATALLVRCNCTYTLEEAKKFYDDECNQDDDGLDEADDFLKYHIGELAMSGRYHEHELKHAHQKLAAARIMCERGKYTELSLADIRKEAVERLKEAFKRNQSHG